MKITEIYNRENVSDFMQVLVDVSGSFVASGDSAFTCLPSSSSKFELVIILQGLRSLLVFLLKRSKILPFANGVHIHNYHIWTTSITLWDTKWELWNTRMGDTHRKHSSVYVA